MLQKLAGVKMPNEDAQKALTSLHAMMKEAVSTKLNLKMSAITEPLFTFNICRGWVGHQTLFLNDVQCWNMLPLNHKLQSRFCVIRFLDFTNFIKIEFAVRIEARALECDLDGMTHFGLDQDGKRVNQTEAQTFLKTVVVFRKTFSAQFKWVKVISKELVK